MGKIVSGICVASSHARTRGLFKSPYPCIALKMHHHTQISRRDCVSIRVLGSANRLF